MKLENQVCSLENAKKLAELGVKVVGIFSWRSPMAPQMDKPADYVNVQWTGPKPKRTDIPAYTVAELGEMLPAFESGPTKEGFWVASDGEAEMSEYLTATTEADARALMLIYLIENGHVKAEELG